MVPGVTCRKRRGQGPYQVISSGARALQLALQVGQLCDFVEQPLRLPKAGLRRCSDEIMRADWGAYCQEAALGRRLVAAPHVRSELGDARRRRAWSRTVGAPICHTRPRKQRQPVKQAFHSRVPTRPDHASARSPRGKTAVFGCLRGLVQACAFAFQSKSCTTWPFFFFFFFFCFFFFYQRAGGGLVREMHTHTHTNKTKNKLSRHASVAARSNSIKRAQHGGCQEC